MWWLLVPACATLAVFFAIAYRKGWPWTGLTEIRREGGSVVQSRKTLWDWMQLLIIPVVLAGLAFALNAAQSGREQRQKANAEREEVLHQDFDQMSQLMLDRELLRASRDSEVAQVARITTLSALRRLDGQRRGLVLTFLQEATLVTPVQPEFTSTIDVAGADLRGADLADASLRGADLDRVDLHDANAQRTDLSNAGLTSANLSDADLRGALLVSATLSDADLRDADLRGAHLTGGADLTMADLRGADLRGADLHTALLHGADLRGANYEDVPKADLAGARLK